MADIYPVFSTDGLNSQITFNFGASAYVGSKPIGYLNFAQDPSEVDVYGGLATTEAKDIAVFAGNVVLAGYLATTEARDTTVFSGIISNPPVEVYPSYSAGGLGSQVTFNFQPVVTLPSGYLYWDLGPHSVIFVTLDATEATDTASFNASVGVSGTLAVTETTDTAAFFGDIVGADLSGNLVYTEPSDIAVFNGQVTDCVGLLAATEAPDVAVFGGSVIWGAILAATEATDSAIFIGELGYISEAPDTAAFVGYVMDVPPVPGVPEVLKFGIPVSLSRW